MRVGTEPVVAVETHDNGIHEIAWAERFLQHAGSAYSRSRPN
jgi:hypothetical protein